MSPIEVNLPSVGEAWICQTKEEFIDLDFAIEEAKYISCDSIPGFILHDLLGWV